MTIINVLYYLPLFIRREEKDVQIIHNSVSTIKYCGVFKSLIKQLKHVLNVYVIGVMRSLLTSNELCFYYSL